jgi:hypothetical protein
MRGASALSSETKAELGFRDCVNEKLEQSVSILIHARHATADSAGWSEQTPP